MLSRQARQRQETADSGQGNEPLGAHPDPLQKEEELEVGRRSSPTEEIEGDQVPEVIGQEGAPGLHRRCAALRHQPGDGTLGHVDAELEELPVDSGGTPQGIRRGHFPDQGGDLGVDGRAAPGGPAAVRAWSPFVKRTAQPML